MADSADTIITATLMRGKNYSFYNPSTATYTVFKRSVPVEVTDEVADQLEELVDVVKTSDGDEIEKLYFDIDRDAERRTEEEAKPRRMRLRMVEASEPKQTKTVSSRTTPVPGRTAGLKVGGPRR